MTKTPKPKSPIALLCEAELPGRKFHKKHKKIAGRKLATVGRAAAIEYLQDKDSDVNLLPPAKARIVALSRPFCEWPIIKVSEAVQEHVFDLTFDEMEKTKPDKTKESRDDWFQKTGLNNYGFTSAQGLNLILSHAYSVYQGVLKKVENRNKKALEKNEKINKSRRENGYKEEPFVPETALKETGHLLHPPGINPVIYCYQQVQPHAYDPLNPGEVKLPEELKNYNRMPDDPIKVTGNRLDIPKGQPGYIPEHQRGLVNPKKNRIRRKYAAQSESLLAVIQIDQDWALLDLRGLLRNVYWRKLAKPGSLTVNSLLKMFSGDPVLYPRPRKGCELGSATFLYDVPFGLHTENTTHKKANTKKLLEKLTEEHPVALVSLDLGQRHPVAARFSRISAGLQVEHIGSNLLPDEFVRDLRNYRADYDKTKTKIDQDAFNSLTPEQQEEIRYTSSTLDIKTKANLCNHLGLDPATIDWDSMTRYSTLVADAFIQKGGDPAKVHFTYTPKNKKSKKASTAPVKAKNPVTKKRTDDGFSKLQGIKPRLSKETRNALLKATWELEKASTEYHRLVIRKNELVKRITNHILREARTLTRCQNVVINMEDLSMASSFFHGKGKKDGSGWESFFNNPKKENRWMIAPLHKALTQAAMHKPHTYVTEGNPARTSITCPPCGHCNAGNRHKDDFVCLRCGYTHHADLLATINIERVALTGKALPKPPRERSNVAKKPMGARKAKKSAGPAKIKVQRPKPQTPISIVEPYLSQIGV